MLLSTDMTLASEAFDDALDALGTREAVKQMCDVIRNAIAIRQGALTIIERMALNNALTHVVDCVKWAK